MKDSELLRLLGRDPYRGMNALSELYAGLIYSVARARLSPESFGDAEVEDLTADVLSSFYLGLGHFDPNRCSIKTYLCVMARNRAVDILRRSSVVSLPLDEVGEVEDSLDVADSIEERELRARLLSGIKELGEPDSSILMRKYYFGESSSSIAAALGLSVSNVDTRAHRAIAKLRERFKGEKV